MRTCEWCGRELAEHQRPDAKFCRDRPCRTRKYRWSKTAARFYRDAYRIRRRRPTARDAEKAVTRPR